jgi:tripartite-type tricarboxylate transporter receptor subunit TctC
MTILAPGRRALLGTGAALLTGGSAWAQKASDYPDRSVRYIVPFPPGGLTDIMARQVAKYLGDIWGKPVVIDNRAGGNAMIGAEAAARSAPDGYTLLAITLTHAVNVSLFPNATYDFKHDFTTISVLGSLPLVVCVNANSPARTLRDLADLARKRELNGGSSGTGSPPHLGLELFRRATGVGPRLIHVPYRGGAPSVTDLVAGNLDLIISNLPECLAQLRGDRLRGLAVTSSSRHPLVPDIPTVREAGMPDLEMTNWTALMTNSGVPAPIRAKIEHDTLVGLRNPAVRKTIEDGGFEITGWDSPKSISFVQTETDRWARLVADTGIRPE